MTAQFASKSQQIENMKKVKAWCEKQQDKIINVNVVSQMGEHESTFNTAHGKIRILEEHPTNKGFYRIEFDSHLQGLAEYDRIGLGYEVSGVIENGEKLTIQKGNQYIELIADN